MTEARLKAGLWVAAQLRRCDHECISAVVARKGDADAGAVLLKLNRLDGTCVVLGRVYTDEGARAWMRVTGEEPVPESDADAYLARQTDFDPDLWILEIDDPRGLYRPDEAIL